MLIQGTSITVTYKRIEGIKRVYYKNENLLKRYFNEATVLPVPDDAPMEIPRIIIKTLNEHAQLNISPIAATFEIHYDDGFERNWNSCSKYIAERMAIVFEFLNFLTNNTYEYIGLITNVLYDEVKQDGTKRIADSLLNSERIKNIYDINIRYTFVEQERMFVNILLRNERLYTNLSDMTVAGSLGQNSQVAESIGAIIDINDRFGFNTNASYKSNSMVLDDLIESMGNIINNKLKMLIEKGEY